MIGPMEAVTVEATGDPKAVLEQAGPYLESRPIEHNVVSSLLHQRVAYPEPGRYWMVRRDHEVVGFALQSPRTFSAGITTMDPAAVTALADCISGEVETHLPGVIADAATAAAFAGRWSELTPGQVRVQEARASTGCPPCNR